MGGGSSHHETSDNASTKTENALELPPSEINDIKHILSLVAPDTPTHCVQMHIRYFRHHPEHLERFCGRSRLPEPKHYSPQQLSSDKQFADRAVIHGLALLQVFRCSNGNDLSAMSRLAAGLAHAHSGMGLTNDVLKDYADVLIEYLKSQFETAMNRTVTLSWRHFLYKLASAMSASSHQLFPPRTLPQQPMEQREKLIQDIQRTMLYDPDTITRIAASLIQRCQRKILKSSPPLTDILKRRKSDRKEEEDDDVNCSPHRVLETL